MNTVRDSYIGAPAKTLKRDGYRLVTGGSPKREYIFSLTVRIPNPVYRLYWKKVEASRERQRQAILDA